MRTRRRTRRTAAAAAAAAVQACGLPRRKRCSHEQLRPWSWCQLGRCGDTGLDSFPLSPNKSITARRAKLREGKQWSSTREGARAVFCRFSGGSVRSSVNLTAPHDEMSKLRCLLISGAPTGRHMRGAHHAHRHENEGHCLRSLRSLRAFTPVPPPPRPARGRWRPHEERGAAGGVVALKLGAPPHPSQWSPTEERHSRW
jgi:hypothetical protein